MALELIQSRSGGRRSQIRCFDMSIKIFREECLNLVSKYVSNLMIQIEF